MKIAKLLHVWCLIVMTSPCVAAGQSTPALQGDPATLPLVTGVENSGWTFYVNVPIVVTGFGFYDHRGDGLVGAQQIRLWKDTSGRSTWPFIDPFTASLIASTTIPDGTNAPLVGGWRLMNLDVSLTLEPGGYEIVNTKTLVIGDPGKFMNGNDLDALKTDPRILLGAPAEGNHSPPEEFLAAYGANLGPMLFIEVPEPRASVLVILGAVMVLFKRRQIRRYRTDRVTRLKG